MFLIEANITHQLLSTKSTQFFTETYYEIKHISKDHILLKILHTFHIWICVADPFLFAPSAVTKSDNTFQYRKIRRVTNKLWGMFLLCRKVPKCKNHSSLQIETELINRMHLYYEGSVKQLILDKHVELACTLWHITIVQ